MSIKKFFVALLVFVIGVTGLVLYLLYEEESGDAYLDTIIYARKCYEQGLIYRAMHESSRASNISPRKTEAYFIKVRCLIQMLDFEEIPEILKKVEGLCKTKHDERIYSYLVTLYNQKKELYDKYIASFDNAKLIKPFLNSMYANDVQVINNAIFYNNYGVRGVCATKDLGINDVIVSVPENMIIFAVKSRKFLAQEYAKADKKKPQEIRDILLKLYKKNTFALGLYILEHQNEPRFKPFIDMINSNDYSSFPLRFDPQTLEILRGTDLEKKYIQLQNALEHDFKLLYTIDSVKKKYDIDTLKNIYLAVSSRNFGWDFSGYNDMIIVPYIDMCNHSSDPNSTWFYDEQRNCFCLKTTKVIPQGGELFDTYGRTKSNMQLLLGYGFCLNGNTKNDEVAIEYPIYSKNGGAVAFLGNKEYMCRKNTDTANNDFPQLLNDIMDEIFNERSKKEVLQKSLIETAKKTMKVVNELAKKKLASYPGTLQEDKNILKMKSEIMTFNERNCYLVRVGEKSVLQWMIDFTEYCTKMLAQSISVDDLKVFLLHKDINPEVKRFFTQSKFFCDFFKDIK